MQLTTKVLSIISSCAVGLAILVDGRASYGMFVQVPTQTRTTTRTDEQASWPQFRGPTGDGIATATDLPIEFSDTQNVVWKSAIDGTGWSSPVINEGKIWFTVAKPTGSKTEPPSSGGLEITFESIDLLLVSFDLKDGQPKDSILLFSVTSPDAIHNLNSYASPTPCIANGKIFCHFGTYGTAGVDCATSKVLWRNDTIKLDHQTGPGSSPVLFQDLVIFHADGTDTQSIVALNVKDGELAWRSQRSGQIPNHPDQKKAFCTPMLTKVAGQEVLVSSAVDWAYVYDPKNGEELYKVPYGKLGFSTVPRPVIKDEVAYIWTGFMKSRLLAIDLAATAFEKPEDRVLWTVENRVPTLPSPVIAENLLFMVSDIGIASCIDIADGSEVWTERLGGKFASSPLFVDGKIYLGDQAGKVFVLQPGREFRVLATNQLDSEVMASPAAVGNAIYIRTAKSLYKISQQ